MNKYKRIKKYFHFTSRSNYYKKLKFARNFIFVYEKRTKDLRPKSGVLVNGTIFFLKAKISSLLLALY